MTQAQHYTQQQLDDFKAEFAKRRRKQILVAIPFGIVLLFVLVARNSGEFLARLPVPPTAVAIGFMAIVLAALGFSFSNWRCPACNAYLGRSLGPHFCPRCGVELR